MYWSIDLLVYWSRTNSSSRVDRRREDGAAWGAIRQRLQRIPRFSVLRRKLLGDYNETPRTPRSGRIINNADNLPPGHIAGYDFNTPEGIAPLPAPLGEIQRTDPQYDDISSDPSGFPKLLIPYDVRVLILA